jgi:hypothetical protein
MTNRKRIIKDNRIFARRTLANAYNEGMSNRHQDEILSALWTISDTLAEEGTPDYMIKSALSHTARILPVCETPQLVRSLGDCYAQVLRIMPYDKIPKFLGREKDKSRKPSFQDDPEAVLDRAEKYGVRTAKLQSLDYFSQIAEGTTDAIIEVREYEEQLI